MFVAVAGQSWQMGASLADEELEPSDLMLPPADITLEEAREEFTGEGLLPD